MHILTALDIVEGFEEADQEHTFEAIQYLIDTGISWQLQGPIGRTTMKLIEERNKKSPLKFIKKGT
jgi:hypothetical protein